MVKKIVILAVVVIQVVRSQRLIAPINYPFINELIEKRSLPVPALSPAESDAICKNFASSIQSVALEKFAQNCLRKPVFGQIAGPLINEIASNVCKCPICSAVNVSPNGGYTKTFIPSAVVSNLLNNANVANNVINVPVNNVPVNNIPVNNVPVSFVIPNNVNLNNVRPVNNVQLSDLLSLLKGLNECSLRGPVVV